MPDINQLAKISAAASKSLGRPEGFALFSPFPFAGMNVQASRIAIADQEWSWRENFVRIGDGNLRTVWDVGPNLYSQSNNTIVSFFFYYIAATPYCAVFFSDGTAVQVNQNTSAVTVISSITGTFYTPGGNLPACVQWGSQYLLISNNNTQNDYWIWDGAGTASSAGLYASGGLGPNVTILANGSNYNSLPTMTVYGGTGSGAVIVPTIGDGGVILLNITNPGSGYGIGDQPQIAFSGGGSDDSAILQAVLASGGVGAVDITNNGHSYTTPPTIGFTGGGGSGAAATALMGVSVITMTNNGSGYTTPPTVTFTGGGGTGATGIAVLSSNTVASVTITDPGTGYTSLPTIGFVGGGGTLAAGTASLYVVGATVTAPGTGYTADPTVSFSGGGGSAAAGSAFLSSVGLASVSVVYGGTGFFIVPLLSVVGGNGTGAILTAVLTPTSVASVNVQAGGTGFFNPPTIALMSTTGVGSGATATAVLQEGSIVQINVTNAGSGYDSPPIVQITPNSSDTLATGAAAIAILVPTSIASVIVTSSGQNYTQTPAVVVQPGANNAAYANIELMPFGISGAAIESYQNRVWLEHPFQQTGHNTTGDVVLVSAPGSTVDFATSDGGLIYTSNSPVLRSAYTGIKVVGDFLYLIGDSSVDVVSNVQTSGNPLLTTFNENNTDPQTGTPWRNTVQDYSRTALFANGLGVYGLYGGAVTKISEKLDELFENALFPPTVPAITPCAAIAEIHEKKVYLLLMTVIDPFTELPRNIMASWDEKEWFVTSQSNMPIFIGTQFVDSVPTAWGTDGKSIYPLLDVPSTKIQKILSTKLYGANSFPAVKLAMSLHLMAQDMSANSAGVSFQTGTLDTENTLYPLLALPLNFGSGLSSTPILSAYTGDIYGCFLGLTVSSTSPDFTLQHLAIGYRVWWSGFGSPSSIE